MVLTKKRIAILMGGESAEREISLLSGKNVISALDPQKYLPIPIVINQHGKWEISATHAVSPGSGAAFLHEQKVDVVFIALHGPYGEDGTVQGMLDLHHIPYVGSGQLASAIAMDKGISRILLASAGICIPPGQVINKQDSWQVHVPGPWFVKPCSLGSSVGVMRVENSQELAQAVENAFQYGPRVVIEQACEGIEITCAVIGNAQGSLETLPPVEIVPQHESFFTYQEKYDATGAQELCPAQSVSAEKSRLVQDLAMQAHRVLGCDGFCRVDFIVGPEKIWVLEVNTIPGMTQRSLVPLAAKTAGFTFAEFVERLISLALEKGKQA